MDQMTKPAAAEEIIELTLTRRFTAAPTELFEAWTDPARIGRWIGPRSVSAEAKAMDPRPGGAYAIAMRLPSGEIKMVRGVYREVEAPERLVFTWAWDDPDGKPGIDTLVTISFRALGQETEMTFHHQRFPDRASRDSHHTGWSGSFDKLAEMLAGRSQRGDQA
jgi:uncharacterized protein YndB with AHSA1/START domain